LTDKDHGGILQKLDNEVLSFQEPPMPAKRYKVLLTEPERHHLLSLISTGKAAARKLTHARILLQADESAGQPHWADQQIREALHVSCRTIERVRQTCVEAGFEAALHHKKRAQPGHQKFDGDTEAHLIAIACSAAPEGRSRWTLQLLADRMVALHHFESISSETIRQVLKKTKLSLG
jgi:Homeodomain-like domain